MTTFAASRTTRLLLLAVSLGLFAPLAAAELRAQEMGITVGAGAPAAAVVSLDGAAMNLSQYYGEKPVVLEFWATWCPLCKELEPAMAAARAKYAGQVTFVSVGVRANQSAARQKAYVEKQKIGGEFVFDANGAAAAAFNVPHTSYMVVIDRAGRVVYTGVGGDQNVEAAVQKAMGAMAK